MSLPKRQMSHSLFLSWMSQTGNILTIFAQDVRASSPSVDVANEWKRCTSANSMITAASVWIGAIRNPINLKGGEENGRTTVD